MMRCLNTCLRVAVVMQDQQQIQMSFLKAFHSDLITGTKRCAHCPMESVVERSSGPLYNNRHSQIMTPPVKMMMIWKMAVSLFSRLVIMGFRTFMVANNATYKWYCALNRLHGAGSFQRSYRFFSQSRNSPHFMEPEGLLSFPKQPATCLYPEPD